MAGSGGSGVGPILGGAGAMLGGLSSYEAAQDNAARARFNARVARMAAADSLQRGEERVFRMRMATARRIGAQIAAYGHAGVDVSSGTPLRTVGQTALMGELDAQTERNNAFRQAWGLNAQASMFESQAASAERQGEFALIGGGLAAAGFLAML